MATALFPFDFMLPFAIRLLPFDFPIRLRAVAVAPPSKPRRRMGTSLKVPIRLLPPPSPCVEPTPDDASVSVSVYAA